VASAVTGLISMRLLPMGLFEANVYVNRPNSIQNLKGNIRADIRRIPQDTLRKVMRSVRRRAEFCLESGEAHLSNTIFKK
jgi:hypothetical protein